MITGLQKIDPIMGDAIYEPVLLREPARPASRQHVLEWLWLANSGKRIPQHAFNELEGAKRDLPVVFDPVTNILPKFGMKYGLTLNVAQKFPSPCGISPAVLAWPSWPWPVGARSTIVAHF